MNLCSFEATNCMEWSGYLSAINRYLEVVVSSSAVAAAADAPFFTVFLCDVHAIS